VIDGLIQRTFSLAKHVLSLAIKEGHDVTDIQIKVPAIRVDYVPFFQISVPLPNMNPQEITLNIRAQKT
jgi:hypothetical protein